MRRMYYECNHCGKEIKDEVIKIRASFINRETEENLETYDGMNDMHFCEKCTRQILKFMSGKDSGKKAKEEREDSSGGVEQEKKNRRLDIGKVMALHNAGWDNAKIADEIRATEEQVYRCIYYQKNKEKWK